MLLWSLGGRRGRSVRNAETISDKTVKIWMRFQSAVVVGLRWWYAAAVCYFAPSRCRVDDTDDTYASSTWRHCGSRIKEKALCARLDMQQTSTRCYLSAQPPGLALGSCCSCCARPTNTPTTAASAAFKKSPHFHTESSAA